MNLLQAIVNQRRRHQYDADAAAYIAMVESVDGEALESEVKQAYNDFIVGCKTDGIWNAIKASCILAGARTLNGCLVPLVGPAPTNTNFVTGDYDRRTGLKGDGTSKTINTGRLNGADPQDNQHLAVWRTLSESRDATRTPLSGPSGTGSSSLITTTTQRFYRSRNQSGGAFNDTTTHPGFYGQSRSNGTEVNGRYNGISDTISQVSETPHSGGILVFSRSSTSFSDGRISFYSVGESLDLEALDARLTTLMSDLSSVLMDGDALAYIAAVESVDGEPLESGVKQAYNDFIIGCKSDEIWDAIKASCILAGARTLNGCLVPLVGPAPTNTNFVTGDYDRKAGLRGATGKEIATGYFNNTLDQDNRHLAVWRTVAEGSSTQGLLASGVATSNELLVTGSGRFYRLSDPSGGVADTSRHLGFVGVRRSNWTQHEYRYNGETTTRSFTSVSSAGEQLFAFSRGGMEYTSARQSFYSIGENLNLVQLEARLATLMSDLSTAIP